MLSDLLNAIPQLRPQLYFKASLTALSHAMEDQVLADNTDQPLLIAYGTFTPTLYIVLKLCNTINVL